MAVNAWKTLKEKRVKFVTRESVSQLFKISNANNAYKLLQRLEKKGVLKRLVSGVYLVADAQATDFEIANICVSPSYVSLESALSYYGILSQFVFSITSVTLKKAKKFTFSKEFEYAQIKPDLFWGFVKDGNFLIARPEKAYLDAIYFQAKGLRKIDFEELDRSSLNKEILKSYSSKMGIKVNQYI